MSDQTGAAQWLTIHDDLLRGMTHALSNRVATILAAASLVGLADTGTLRPVETLRAEAERLDELLRTMRLLPRRLEGAMEPIMPGDAAHVAIELHAHHPEWRDVSCTVQLLGDVAPAWADPARLALALAAALTSGKRLAAAHGDVTIRISSTDERVRFDVGAAADAPERAMTGDEGTERARDAGAAAWLLADSGAVVTTHAGGIVIDVPTLAAVRRTRTR